MFSLTYNRLFWLQTPGSSWENFLGWMKFLHSSLTSYYSTNTGSAKFMAAHILTWFSNKNEENWKFIAAAYNQITCISIHLSFIQYGLFYL